MPKFKPNTSPAMKRSGFKMAGYSYPGTSPVQNKNEEAKPVDVSKEEAKKKKALEIYNKNLETKASDLYASDRAFRTGGNWSTADEKTKTEYRAKAQKSSPATKSSPAKGGWWAKQTKGHGGVS